MSNMTSAFGYGISLVSIFVANDVETDFIKVFVKIVIFEESVFVAFTGDHTVIII